MNDSTNNAEAFETFYRSARTQLLVQTIALTGDFPAARSAVRDAFIAAWHHWRKVNLTEDPASWVRPVAWNYATRRATARVWHRDKFDPELRLTLQSLGRLPIEQRKVLLLAELSDNSLRDIAREAGVSGARAVRDLSAARARFATERDSQAPLVQLLAPLTEIAESANWPRPSILRRAGATRRRLHTAIGAAALLASLAAAGVAVSDDGTVRPELTAEQVTPSAEPVEVVDPPAPEPRLVKAGLLSVDQVSRLSPGADWSKTRTHGNTEGDGLMLPCQQERFADPQGAAALVREFNSTPGRPARPAMSALQFAELSRSSQSAETAYDKVLSWFADCTEPRIQLVSAERLGGVGDQAMLFTLRSWNNPATTHTVGAARTGAIITTTAVASAGRRGTDVRAQLTSLVAASVNDLCGRAGAGRCAAPPEREAAAPPPVGKFPGLLSQADLPPVGKVTAPWLGTGAEPTTENLASTRCDGTSFARKPVLRNLSRTFVITDAQLPPQFGLTQTAGLTRRKPAAITFTDGIRNRLEGCEKKDLGASVTNLKRTKTADTELYVWEVRIEVSEKKSVTYLMSVMRSGRRVAQVSFVPAPGAEMTATDFIALSSRALDRLPYLAP
ncbi:MAG: hypothetical protein ACRCYQ_03410 [Nocardioides sp.]